MSEGIIEFIWCLLIAYCCIQIIILGVLGYSFMKHYKNPDEPVKEDDFSDFEAK